MYIYAYVYTAPSNLTQGVHSAKAHKSCAWASLYGVESNMYICEFKHIKHWIPGSYVPFGSTIASISGTKSTHVPTSGYNGSEHLRCSRDTIGLLYKSESPSLNNLRLRSQEWNDEVDGAPILGHAGHSISG